MPLKIPVYERRVQAQSTLSSTPQISKPVAASFGMDVGQAIQGASKGFDQWAQVLQQKKEKERTQATLEKSSAHSIAVQNEFYSDEKDDQGRPKGLLRRNNNDAKGSTIEFDSRYESLKKKFLDEAADDDVRLKLSNEIESRRDNFRNTVIRHEVDQSNSALSASHKAWQGQMQSDAALAGDAGSIKALMDSASARNTEALMGQGFREEGVLVQQNQALLGAMAKQNAKAWIDKDPKRAEALYLSVKDKLSGDDQAEIATLIDGKKIYDQQLQVWGQVKGHRLSDGTPDLAAIERHVRGLDVPTDRQEKILNYVQAKAGEHNQQRKAREAAADYGFKARMIEGKRKGLDLDGALNLAASFGGDSVQIQERQEIAKKFYTKDITTNREVYMDLWSDVMDGRAGLSEINSAAKAEHLSGDDATELSKLIYNVKHRSDESIKKQTVDDMSEVAKEKFGNSREGKKKLTDYRFTVNILSRGKSPDETRKIAEDNLKQVVTSPGWIWDSKADAYEIEKQGISANQVATGKLHADLGERVADALGGVNRIDAVSKDLGVSYDQLKIGTPTNSAILSLKKSGKAINKKNLDAVLSRFKDGVIR